MEKTHQLERHFLMYTHVANSDFETGGPTANQAFNHTSKVGITPCHNIEVGR